MSKEYADEINRKSRYTKTLQDIGEILVKNNYNTEKSEPKKEILQFVALVPNQKHLS
jgi:hypothetical protein